MKLRINEINIHSTVILLKCSEQILIELIFIEGGSIGSQEHILEVPQSSPLGNARSARAKFWPRTHMPKITKFQKICSMVMFIV